MEYASETLTEVGVREKTIERKLAEAVRKHGGIAPKFVSPGFNGMPDRLVLMPKGRMSFVEVKAPGRNPRALQLARHELLRRLGFKVYVLDEVDGIENIVTEIGRRETGGEDNEV